MPPEPAARDVRGACPLDCPDTCSWIVTVKRDEATALRGDPPHPYERGSLCNKVAAYLTYARSSDRMLRHLQRPASLRRYSCDSSSRRGRSRCEDCRFHSLRERRDTRRGSLRGFARAS